MAELFTIDNAGVRVATLAGAKERFDDLNKEVFGADIDTGTFTPQNQIAGINAQIWAEVGEQIQRTAIYGSDLNHAPGKFLDAFGSLFGIKRRVATRTRVECELTGVDGAIIPQGSLVRNIKGDHFSSDDAVEIVDGKATAVFTAVNIGPIPAGVGEVNDIVSVGDPRWKSVINKSSGIIGTLEESDTEYRSNLKKLTALASSGTISAIRSGLEKAGASKIVILENSTDSSAVRSGITIPARSLLIVAEGGVMSDLTRAYESYRPIGTSTHALAAASKEWVASDTGNINLGAFRYNKTNFTGIDFTGDTTISNLQTTLNAISNGPSFTASGNIPMLSYTWSPDIVGFEEAKGNISEEVVGEGLSIVKAFASPSSNRIFMEFSDDIESYDSVSFEHTRTGEIAPAATAISSSIIRGRAMVLYTNPALPSDLESITFSSIKVVSKNLQQSGTQIVHNFTNIVGEVIDTPSSSQAPTNAIVSGTPIDGGISLQGVALGTVSNWQYIRFDGVEYIDKDANGNMEWKSFNPVDSGFLSSSLTGFTNNRSGSKVLIRPYNNTGGAGPESVLLFECSDIAPTLDGDVVADGLQITIPFDRELQANVETGTIPWWVITVEGSARSVVKQVAYRNKIYLQLSSAITHGQTLSVRYNASLLGAHKGITSYSGINAATFSVPYTSITNTTLRGLPSQPMEYRVFKTGNNLVRAVWGANYGGGQTIDSYEYSLSYDGGVQWTDWVTLANNATQVEVGENTISQLPNRIRARASNPNAQTLQKLGFTGMKTLAPITRPVEHRLAVSITLNQASELVRDALNEIKTALVNRVNAYDMGETIWVNDLLAVAELVQGARITNISVTHGGSNVNNVAQPAYVNWTLRAEDITFT